VGRGLHQKNKGTFRALEIETGTCPPKRKKKKKKAPLWSQGEVKQTKKKKRGRKTKTAQKPEKTEKVTKGWKEKVK